MASIWKSNPMGFKLRIGIVALAVSLVSSFVWGCAGGPKGYFYPRGIVNNRRGSRSFGFAPVSNGLAEVWRW